MFMHFGEVKEIKINNIECFALITFAQAADAFLALSCLDKYLVKALDLTLQVRWVKPESK